MSNQEQVRPVHTKTEQASNGLYPVAAPTTVEEGGDNYNSIICVWNDIKKCSSETTKETKLCENTEHFET